MRALEGEAELSQLAAVLRGDPRAGARALADRCDRQIRLVDGLIVDHGSPANAAVAAG